jgi:hypothetical protein
MVLSIYEKIFEVLCALMIKDNDSVFHSVFDRISHCFMEDRSWPLNIRGDEIYEWYLGLLGGPFEKPSFAHALWEDELINRVIDVPLDELGFPDEHLETREWFVTAIEGTEVPVNELLERSDANVRGCFLEFAKWYRTIAWESDCYSSHRLIVLESDAIGRFLSSADENNERDRHILNLIDILYPFENSDVWMSGAVNGKYYSLAIVGATDFIEADSYCGYASVFPRFIAVRGLLKEYLKEKELL